MTALIAAAAVCAPLLLSQASAASGDRTLYLHYTHTGETAKITFRRNGRYDQQGLKKLNHFLRDWRQGEPTEMDPRLFDLVWEVYQDVNATKPIHVVSAYRAPETNAMLRKRSNGVAKKSRHIMGMAMDFYIPGVPISELRKAAMKKQIGGVGYYPASNSPFVHLDTGNVRAWPRMTRSQLASLFPDGKTLHLPASGGPLSQKGYAVAKAEWSKCHEVPCGSSSGGRTRVADNDSGPKRTLMDWFFNADEEDEGNEEAVVTRVASASAAQSASRAPATPPVPHDRPNFAGTVVADAPVPARRETILTARAETAPEPAPAEAAVTAIAENTAPTPRTHMTRPDGTREPTLTAYAPEAAGGRAQDTSPPESRMAATAGPEAGVFEVASDSIQTASVGGAPGLDTLDSLIQGTWDAVVPAREAGAAQAVHKEAVSRQIAMRRASFVAPDLEHVAAVFVDPAPVTGTRYAVITEHDQADFAPATELGRHTGHVVKAVDASWGLKVDRFVSRAPLVLAQR